MKNNIWKAKRTADTVEKKRENFSRTATDGKRRQRRQRFAAWPGGDVRKILDFDDGEFYSGRDGIVKYKIIVSRSAHHLWCCITENVYRYITRFHDIKKILCYRRRQVFCTRRAGPVYSFSERFRIRRRLQSSPKRFLFDKKNSPYPRGI